MIMLMVGLILYFARLLHSLLYADYVIAYLQ